MQPIIYAVGFGPGDQLYMTTQAVSVLQKVDVVVGYTTYVKLLRAQFPGETISLYFHATGSRTLSACSTDCFTGKISRNGFQW